MRESEIIHLDAVVESVINKSAFRAVLANGHRFVAVQGRDKEGKHGKISVCDKVKVAMSPFDMSVGHVRWEEKVEA